MKLKEFLTKWEWLDLEEADKTLTESEQKIWELMQKNAQLDKQLQNAVVPKFKIGQEIWYKPNGIVYKSVIESIKVKYKLGGYHKIQYVVVSYDGYRNHKNEKDLFASEQEVKSKMQEE